MPDRRLRKQFIYQWKIGASLLGLVYHSRQRSIRVWSTRRRGVTKLGWEFFQNTDTGRSQTHSANMARNLQFIRGMAIDYGYGSREGLEGLRQGMSKPILWG